MSFKETSEGLFVGLIVNASEAEAVEALGAPRLEEEKPKEIKSKNQGIQKPKKK